MRVLLTGHKGYIGTVMLPMLEAAGHEVVGVDSDLYRFSTFGAYREQSREIIRDVRDIERADLEGIDAVVHLAALSNDVLGDLNPEITYEINHRASVRLAEMARDVGVGRFVFASSCSMYGASGAAGALTEEAPFAPITAYAKSKVLVEQDVARMASESFCPTFMRNATAYGVSPRMRFDVVVNNLTAWAYTTGEVHLKSDGSAWRPLVHIEDISRAVVAVLNAPADQVRNQAFNIGRNQDNYRISEIAEFVREAVPNSTIGFAEGASADERNYQVDFSKYETSFPNHPLRWTVPKGIEQIYQAYRAIGLELNDFEGARYKRIAQLKELLGRGELDESLRWVLQQPALERSV